MSFWRITRCPTCHRRITSAAQKLSALFGSLLILYLLVLSLTWVLTLPERTRAGAFLQDFTKLEPGKSSFADAQQLAKKYGGFPDYVATNDMRCTFQKCVFTFIFENKPLTSSRFARYTELVGSVFIRDGVFIGREITYGRDGGRRPSMEYDVVEAPMFNAADGTVHGQSPEGLWRLNVNDKGMPYVVRVTLSPSSSEDVRRRAYALDLSCLAGLFGCNSPSALFPHGIEYRGTPYQTHSDTW
jgi:hypothetical protein